MQTVCLDYFMATYIAADIFFYFSENQKRIALKMGSSFGESYSIGSLKSIFYQEDSKDNYDIIFVE